MVKEYPFRSVMVARTEAGQPGEIIGESWQVASGLCMSACRELCRNSHTACGLEKSARKPELTLFHPYLFQLEMHA